MSLSPVDRTLRMHPNARDLAELLVAAEHRESKYVKALQRIETYCGDNWRYEQIREFARHALADEVKAENV